MIEKNLVVRNHSGLHARPASLLVNQAGQFACRLTLTKAGKEVDLKSILGIMSLAVSEGEEICIKADGIDEAEAIAKLTQLIESGLGE